MEKIFKRLAFTGFLLLVFLHSVDAQKDNRYVTPPAIGPISGYLSSFSPVQQGNMKYSFSAKYELLRQYGQTYGAKSFANQDTVQKGKSINEIAGSLDLKFSNEGFIATEIRNAKDGTDGFVRTNLKSKGKYHSVKKWEMESYVNGVPTTRLLEKGSWNRKILSISSKNFQKNHKTGDLVIANWSLIPLLSSGKLKTTDSFQFDLLQNSTYFPNQEIKYEGVVEITVADGEMEFDSYSHTGWGKVPIHYLVDKEGRVQLITISTVSWVLKELN